MTAIFKCQSIISRFPFLGAPPVHGQARRQTPRGCFARTGCGEESFAPAPQGSARKDHGESHLVRNLANPMTSHLTGGKLPSQEPHGKHSRRASVLPIHPDSETLSGTRALKDHPSASPHSWQPAAWSRQLFFLCRAWKSLLHGMELCGWQFHPFLESQHGHSPPRKSGK